MKGKHPTGIGSIADAINYIAGNYLDSVDSLICRVASPETTELLAQNYAIPDEGPHSVEDVLKEAEEINRYRVRMDHRRFFGFIPSPVLPVSWLADVVASSFNVHAGSRLQSSGASAIEKRLIHWMATIVGLSPNTAGGIAVSGGSMANLTAMVLARDNRLPRDKRSVGVAYVSDQTHSSVAKGLRILGFSDDQVRKIRCDDQFRMLVSVLRDAITEDRGKGLYPFLVIATYGTTNTGAIDPIHEVITVAQRERLWMHVDGAYGASALLSRAHRKSHLGLAGIDSLYWDAHKWLFQTYACGFVLVKDQALLYNSFRTGAEYVQDAAEMDHVPNYWNLGMELTRPARATKLWFTLRVLGLQRISEMLDHGIRLAEIAEKEVRKLPHWQITSRASLAIVTFRYAPEDKSDIQRDRLNTLISQWLIAEDIAGALTTRIHGRVVLRMCCIHPDLTETELKDIVWKMGQISTKLSDDIS
jgi:glutamate/tyrosine decarboxylase-like PLP-dependent enzyme